MSKRIAPHNVAKGVRHGPNDMRVLVSFDDETFFEIRKRAVNAGTSFAEQVRILCEWDLLSEGVE